MKRFSLFAVTAFFLSAIVVGQGSQTSTLVGTVTLADRSRIPGISVTISSPALQGTRTQATGANGDYVFKFLHPGTYTVSFALAGMKTVSRTATLELGGTTRTDAVMEIAGTQETVTVTDEALRVDRTAVHGATFEAEQISALPIARNLAAIASLTPGLTTATPNAGQLSISGAFAYDNVFLLDGVDINDNLFGTATGGLVIEEAVEETQILTSAISAEYGRFSGGVINAVTKSGGNEFHGSLRADLLNDDWRENTPFEDAQNVVHPDDIQDTYSATLGGYAIKDRLWFFLAGRSFTTEAQTVLPVTGETFTGPDEETRYEVKLTGNISQSHTLQGSYVQSDRELTRVAFAGSTLRSVEDETLESPTFPAKLYVGSYQGVLTDNLFASLQYSEKKFQFQNNGGGDTNLVTGSPFLTATFPILDAYHAPYFDQTDPEDRNNKQWAASLNYYLSTARLGSHDLKLGGEVYNSIRTGGNSQSPTNYVFYADYLGGQGTPILDASGRLIPVWVPGESYIANYIAIRGAETDLETKGFYFNDIWRLNKNLTANLGVRYEKVDGTGPGGSTITDTDSIVPRLGISYDVQGDGKIILSGTYAQYAGKYNDTQFGSTTNVGNPDGIYSVYLGPEGQGYDFAPAFDLTNNYEVFAGTFPTQNTFFENGLSSPIVTEFTLNVGGQLRNNVYAAVTYVNRETDNFVENFITIEDGQTEVIVEGVSLPFDNIVYRNTDALTREYQALQFQGRVGINPRWLIDLNYTYMIKFEGNFEGEAANQPGISSIFGNRPEILALDRQLPSGRLSGFQKHKVRFLTSFGLPTPIGNFALGLIYNFDSGRTYTLSSNIGYTAIQRARDPGYATIPSLQTIAYGERGSGTFPSQSRVDMALNYEIPIWKSLAPHVQLRVFNVLGTNYRNGFSTVVNRCRLVGGALPAGCTSADVDANGISTTFTTVGTSFGQVVSNAQYQRAREFQISAGIRF